MTSSFICTNLHVISPDAQRYPRNSAVEMSAWSRSRPVDVDGMVASMDDAGVQKATIVHLFSCYGFDNSYACDAAAKYPGRFTVVASVDVRQSNAPAVMRDWITRGATGFILNTGEGSEPADMSWLDDPKSFPAWSLIGDLGQSICVRTSAIGLAQVAGLAKRFPKVKIILDHLSRPELDDGPPYNKAVSLFALSAFENVYLKMTSRTFEDATKGKASPETFFPKLVSVFGASRICWGSNYPAQQGTMKSHLETAKRALACLSANDQALIFARTAQFLYPALAD